MYRLLLLLLFSSPVFGATVHVQTKAVQYFAKTPGKWEVSYKDAQGGDIGSPVTLPASTPLDQIQFPSTWPDGFYQAFVRRLDANGAQLGYTAKVGFEVSGGTVKAGVIVCSPCRVIPFAH